MQHEVCRMHHEAIVPCNTRCVACITRQLSHATRGDCRMQHGAIVPCNARFVACNTRQLSHATRSDCRYITGNCNGVGLFTRVNPCFLT